MDIETHTDALGASFDLVARQDAADEAIGLLRSDVEEVKTRLDRVGRAAVRPALGLCDGPEVKGFVDGYLRQGRTTELKSMTGTVPADGGYAVPREVDATIARQVEALSPIRRLAQVVQVGSAGYRKLVSTGGTASGWVSETAGRPETATPKFEEIAPPFGELYANPAASQAMLDDAAFDLEGWLASEIALEFARAEGAAFVNGSGLNQRKGFRGPSSKRGLRPIQCQRDCDLRNRGEIPACSAARPPKTAMQELGEVLNVKIGNLEIGSIDRGDDARAFGLRFKF